MSAIIQSWYATEEWKNLGEVIELLFTLVDTYERMGGSTRAQKWLDKEIQLLISQSSNTTITVNEEKRDGQMNIAL